MDDVIFISLAVYFIAVFIFIFLSWLNALGYKDIEPQPYLEREHPFVSVVIPSRNEIDNIRICLDSLVNQDYPDYEILVVDGDSTDGTREIIKEFSSKHPKVKLVEEKPLPKGWVGKSFACYQGALAAKGDWFLFIDADTRHNPYMINSVMLAVQRGNFDFFSLMTGQIMESFWENVILPNVFLWFGTRFPIRKVNNAQSQVARATGQFIAIKKEVYFKTGGHESIKSKVVEDFAFSHLVKKAGFRIAISGGRKIVSTRMYRNYNQIIEGFTKNIFFAAGENILSTIYACGYVFFTQIAPFIVPFSLFFVKQADIPKILLSLLPLCVIIIMRLQLNRLLNLSNKYILTIPVGGMFTVFLHINSAITYYSGKGMAWKGRKYVNN